MLRSLTRRRTSQSRLLAAIVFTSAFLIGLTTAFLVEPWPHTPRSLLPSAIAEATDGMLDDGTIQVAELFTGSSVIKPDYVLLQDDKGLQAADNPIVRLSMEVREGRRLELGRWGDTEVSFYSP